MAEPSIGNTRCRVYDVSINSVNVGYTEKQSLKVKAKTRPITVSQLQELVVGDRIVGMEVSGTIWLKEVNLTNLKLALPWSSAAGALSPAAMGGDMYDHAVPIKFHPRDVTGTTEDITIDKAVITGGLDLEGDGTKDSTIPLTFTGYPDRTQLPTTVDFGQIG